MNSSATLNLFVALIARENVPRIWAIVKDKLAKALEDWGNGDRDEWDLYDDLIAGKAQLWVSSDANHKLISIAIMRVIIHPKKSRLLFDILVGEELESILALRARVEDWMRTQGLIEFEVHARPGLAKLLEKHGTFKRKRVVLFSEIEHVNLSKV